MHISGKFLQGHDDQVNDPINGPIKLERREQQIIDLLRQRSDMTRVEYAKRMGGQADKPALSIKDKLENGVKDVFSSDGYKEYLNFCAKLPRYSVNNQILIMLQKPEATMCQSFGGWKDMNRHVKKGENAACN
jgi:hypothetical protein